MFHLPNRLGLARTTLWMFFFGAFTLNFVTPLDKSAASTDEESFRSFFHDVVRTYPRDNGTFVLRWPSPLIVCVFGDYSQLSSDRFKDLFHFIQKSTDLRINTQYTIPREDCAQDTLLYVRIHSGDKGKTLRQMLIKDLGSVVVEKGRKETSSTLEPKPYGMGTIVLGGGQPSAIYVAVDQFDRNETPFDEAMARKASQEEIFQVLVGAADVSTAVVPKSIIEEPILNIDKRDWGLEPKYREEVFKSAPSNMCFYDVMLLLTLYGPGIARENPESKLDLYHAFIHENFDQIKRRATDLMNDDDYKSIFVKKC